MMKINYIIATWSGRRLNGRLDLTYYQKVLANHLNVLNKTINDLTQITIMRPFNPVKNKYYDVELNDNMRIIDCENKYQSYGQWLKAVELYLNDFDYFIFIEDDYVPTTDNFDTKLIKIYEEGSYLCSYANQHHLGGWHAAVSNGIISRKTIENALLDNNYEKWFNDYARRIPNLVFGGRNFQIAFSTYLIENNIKIKDYLNHYPTDYHQDSVIQTFGNTNNEGIFSPIQKII